MAKRAPDNQEESCQKRAKVEEDPELEAVIQERVRQALAQQAVETPLLLQETFTVNCPVHGLMHLPGIVKVVVDTQNFQRMRHIKQLGICALVYPGATHNRFFHSLGTAFLSWELVKGLRQRQPELGITNRDMLCAVLAGLCHDLGHPSYSHMFEVFVHELGRQKRMNGEPDTLVKKYTEWTHEQASVMLLQQMFKDLKGPLVEAGLCIDEDGDDFACIAELIDPPKKALEALLNGNKLLQSWDQVIKGRPVRKAWLYEIVSNWRSGIDVDKFDYFRRDALFLGIQRQFDHNRYLKGVKVVIDKDEGGVLTISPPEKDKDSIRENMMELRKMLHGAAYQHKTVKKMEAHMVDILKQMDEVVRVTGVGGQKLRMSEAAIYLDHIAYPKLTDTFVECLLLSREDPALQKAADEYQVRVLQRQMMRRVAEWDPPRLSYQGPEAASFHIPDAEDIIAGMLREYPDAAKNIAPHQPVRNVPPEELRCQVAKIHYGMGDYDPITRIVFHCTKSDQSRGFRMDGEAKPLRQKVFIFWNPPVEELQDTVTLQRLNVAFLNWARPLVEGGDVVTMPASPVKPKRTSLGANLPVPAFEQESTQPVPAAPPAAPTAPAVKPRRMLRVQSSCPPDPVLGTS